MKTLKIIRYCNTQETVARGLMGIHFSSNECALFVFSQKAIWPVWGKGMLQDCSANYCADGIVQESLFIPAGCLDAVVPENEYMIMFETSLPFAGAHVSFLPDRILVDA